MKIKKLCIILYSGIFICFSCQKQDEKLTEIKFEAYNADSILQLIITNTGKDTLTFSDNFEEQSGEDKSWKPAQLKKPYHEIIYYCLLPGTKIYLNYNKDSLYTDGSKIKLEVTTSRNDTCNVISPIEINFQRICFEQELIPLYKIALLSNVHNYYYWDIRIDNRTDKLAFSSPDLLIDYHPFIEDKRPIYETGNRLEQYKTIEENEWQPIFSSIRDLAIGIQPHRISDRSQRPPILNRLCREGIYRLRASYHFEREKKSTILVSFLEQDSEIKLDSMGRTIVIIKKQAEDEEHFIEHNGWNWNTDLSAI